MAESQDIRYEDAVDQIEAIIDKIESGRLGLEEAIKQCSQGKKLITHCRTVLDAAEKRIAELVVDENDQLVVDNEDDQDAD
mgnify:CR=1 FL=1